MNRLSALFLLLLHLTLGQKVADSDHVIKAAQPRRPKTCGACEPESCESPILCIAGLNPVLKTHLVRPNKILDQHTYLSKS